VNALRERLGRDVTASDLEALSTARGYECYTCIYALSGVEKIGIESGPALSHLNIIAGGIAEPPNGFIDRTDSFVMTPFVHLHIGPPEHRRLRTFMTALAMTIGTIATE
jgi:hypothetical protein